VTKKPTKKAKDADSNVQSDHWERFERAVDIAVAKKPLHRSSKKTRKRPATS
jgi:hypothetical protein